MVVTIHSGGVITDTYLSDSKLIPGPAVVVACGYVCACQLCARVCVCIYIYIVRACVYINIYQNMCVLCIYVCRYICACVCSCARMFLCS